MRFLFDKFKIIQRQKIKSGILIIYSKSDGEINEKVSCVKIGREIEQKLTDRNCSEY